jgi:hypothetical protein
MATQPQTKPAPVKRVPVQTKQKWSMAGKEFTGPREDVLATIAQLQSVPDEFAVAAMAAINALDKSVRGVRLSLHFTSTGDEFSINGHCKALF